MFMIQTEFDHIFRTYHAALCVYARGIVNDAHIAEDLVEDVFLNIWQRDDRKKAIVGDWRPFLYISVRNRCYSYLRQYKKTVPVEAIPLSIADEEDMEILYIEINRQVMQALDKLPEQCGKVVRMSYLENLSTSEIASRLGITESTVYNHKKRGISLLKEMLSGAVFYSIIDLLH